jgi:hypothetical protein
MEAIDGIKRGLQSMKSNAGKPAAEFFREFFAEKGIADEEWSDLSSSLRSQRSKRPIKAKTKTRSSKT